MAKKVKAEEIVEEKTEEQKKQEALKSAIDKINKKYNGNAVMKLGWLGNLDIPTISTGILPLDVALGIGGLPRGRIIEIYGPEASGKTTVTLYMIAEAQKNGGTAAFIDAEHALDPTYAKKLGVDIDELLISQPDNGEQALEISEQLISSGAIDIIIIDSVAALVPKTEIDGEMGDAQIGLHARMMSKAMRKLAGVISKTNTVAVFINQIRDKVGVMFGNPETTTGGKALKFYSTIRMEVRRGEVIKETVDKKETIVGNGVRVKIVKNKVAPPFRSATFDLIYGVGYDRIAALLDVGIALNIFRQKGSFLYYGEESPNEKSFAQGRDKALKYLKEHPEMVPEVEQKIHESLKKGIRPEVEEIELPGQSEENKISSKSAEVYGDE